MNPASNLIPSVTSNSSSKVLPSLTVITPSLPTFSMADANKLPMCSSPLAEMVATWAISSAVVISFLFCCKKLTTASTAAWEPLLKSMGLHPAATFLTDSVKMDAPKMVAEVVPSPADSLVLEATSCNNLAPMSSNASSKVMDAATVTPSLVILGDPNCCSIKTFLPLGPKVTETASAKVLTPFNKAAAPSTPNFNSLCDKERTKFKDCLLKEGLVILNMTESNS